VADGDGALRSAEWFDREDLNGFGARASLKLQGFPAAAFRGRPVIGICNTWSELNGCNAHLRDVAESVKRGVIRAGGFPLEFPVMSLGEPLMRPTTMLYRNLMAMDVEETIRANPLDGVVLLTGCDKTNPAAIMGASSADIPAIVVTGGPMLSGHWRGRTIGSCTDCWHYHEELRAGRIDEQEFHEIEDAMCRSAGHCMTMGTASTMACLTEALGMCLPGSAAIPAADSRRQQVAEASGAQAVELVRRDLTPSQIMTAEAFDNAIRVLHAISGSTNAILHLLAIAGRLGVDLSLDRFDELSATTPWLVNLKPAGEHLMEDLYYAGGVPAVMNELRALLHLDCPTVTGAALGDGLAAAEIVDPRVIATADAPLDAGGSLVVLRGSLCPDGAVLKTSSADPRLLAHEGRAVVFEDIHDLQDRFEDPALDIDGESIMVLRNAGPAGAPGMPEWGHLPIPSKLLRAGVRDLVRISDGRMSGTSFGTVVLHVAPESAVGGPLALVRDGDRIRLDVERRRLDLLVAPEELADRRRAWSPPAHGDDRGYRQLYRERVLQADRGCDFDFLRGRSAVERDALTHV
jgi:dihydroxy-acid dehydratase